MRRIAHFDHLLHGRSAPTVKSRFEREKKAGRKDDSPRSGGPGGSRSALLNGARKRQLEHPSKLPIAPSLTDSVEEELVVAERSRGAMNADEVAAPVEVPAQRDLACVVEDCRTTPDRYEFLREPVRGTC